MPKYYVNKQGNINLEEPKKCPKCHHAISPNFLIGTKVNRIEIDLAFECTNCNYIFIANYIDSILNKTLPKEYIEHEFEKEISETSPSFVEIYNQALYAESKNLDQLTGIGLRKALEFLIKDFLISKGENEETIKSTTLSRCINNYIDDVKLKKVSERAVWLGNDETHYVKKWEDKDIKDLKLLIQVTVNMIHNDLLTEKYLSEMEN